MAISGGGPPPDPASVLLKMGLISQEQYEAARSRDGNTVQHLIDDGLVGERVARRIETQLRARELGIGFVDLDRIPIDPTATLSLPPEFAREFGVLPVKLDGKTLYAVFRDTINPSAIARAEEASGLRVIPVMALRADVESALDQL